MSVMMAMRNREMKSVLVCNMQVCCTDYLHLFCKINADIDECAVGTSGCDVNAYCTNTIGGNNCTCNTGFIGTGRTCTPGIIMCRYRFQLI